MHCTTYLYRWNHPPEWLVLLYNLPLSLESSTRMTGITVQPTSITGIIHQNDLMKILWRTTVDDTVHSPEDGTYGLIEVDDHHTGCWQTFGVDDCLAAVKNMD